MSAQLSMPLMQLESLPSALDIVRYLAKHPEHAAWPEEIMDDLQISERRYAKAIRRLVTLEYARMRGDNRYELTRKGEAAADELIAYDAQTPSSNHQGAPLLRRHVVIALPRQLAVGQPTEVLIGFEPTSSGFVTPVEVALRLETHHAELNIRDELLKLSRAAITRRFTLTPSFYDAVRLTVKVFQLAADGEDLTYCGGTYVDVHVVPAQPNNLLTAYRAAITFRE